MKKTNFTNSIGLNKSYKVISTMLIFLFFSMLSLPPIHAQCSISCADVNLSVDITTDVDGNCEATLSPGAFATPATNCSGLYAIVIKHGETVVFDSRNFLILPLPIDGTVDWVNASDYIKKTLTVSIIALNVDGTEANSCWAYLTVEDKVAPTIIAGDDIAVDCCAVSSFVPPTATDCSGLEEVRVVNEVTITDCNVLDGTIAIPDGSGTKLDGSVTLPDGTVLDKNKFVKILIRQYIAIDKCGNKTPVPVTKRVFVKRLNQNPFDPSDLIGEDELVNPIITCPPNFEMAKAYNCDDVDPCDLDGDGFPDATSDCAGVPFLDKNKDGDYDAATDILLDPLNVDGAVTDEDLLTYCKVGSTLEEVAFPFSDCKKKLMRIWRVTEWYPCGGEFTWTCTQIIEVLDNEGPVILNGPHDFETSTNGYDCEGYARIPAIEAEDNCGDVTKVSVNICSLDADGVTRIPTHYIEDFDVTNGEFAPLSVGVNIVKYTAYDECHQTGEYELIINVADHTPPVTICDDHTVVSLTYDGQAEVPAEVFDDGSFDDCGLKKFLVRRMNPSCDCENQHPKFPDMHYLGAFTDSDTDKDHHYYVSKEKFPGFKACKLSDAMGGYSVQLDTENEANWLQAQIDEHKGSNVPYYIGLKDREHEGVFEWSGDGSTFTESSACPSLTAWCPWAANQPNNGVYPPVACLDRNLNMACAEIMRGVFAPMPNNEDYVSVLDGKWNDIDGNMPLFYVMELEDPCGFSGYAKFCCEDDTEMVVFRAVDKWGNYNDCMVEVEIQNKFPPVLECPPDVVVKCDLIVDLDNLEGYFGTLVDNQADRGSLLIPAEYLLIPNALSGVATGGDFSGADPDRDPLAEFYCATELGLGTGEARNLWDGYAYNNCGSVGWQEETPIDNRDQCGRGNIIRTFTIPGTNLECKQKIVFERQDEFAGSILLPIDLDFDDCINLDIDTRVSLDPDVLTQEHGVQYGKPRFDEDACDLVGMNFTDEVFYFNDSEGSACFKVIRTWTIIDWCALENGGDLYVDLNPNAPGVQSHQQIFKINNTIDPVITGCEDQMLCTYDAQCQDGRFRFSTSATDECTTAGNMKWKVFLQPEGSDSYSLLANSAGYVSSLGDNGDATSSVDGDVLTVSVEFDFPIGTHTIKWQYLDQCGNVATCLQEIQIVNCKAPTPYCITALAVDIMAVDAMDENGDPVLDGNGSPVTAGMVNIWASDFATGSGLHPCIPDDEIIYSFSPDITDQDTTFTCCAAGAFVSLDIYSTVVFPDGTIAQAYCTANLNVQDNMGACSDFDTAGCPETGGGGTPGNAKISGFIATENNDKLEEVEVRLVGSEFAPASTNADGEYAFPSMPAGGDYLVDPKNDIYHDNGVSTLDLVLIQKHILGLQTLNSPFKIIAADINKDSRVSASDLVELRKLILGVDTEYDQNESWRFVSNEYTFNNPSNPLIEFFIEKYDISGLNQDMIVDFTAIKVGDVNTSLQINNLTDNEVRSKESVTLIVDKQDFKKGDVVTIPVNSLGDMSLLGMQYTASFDANVLEYSGISAATLNVDENNIGKNRIENGIFTFSWHTANQVSADNSAELFKLTFIAKQDGNTDQILSINSKVTAAEAYSNTVEIMDVNLTYRDGANIEVAFNLYQNSPNPFKEATTIGFDLPANDFVNIRVYDVTGKTITQINGEFAKGYNEVVLDKKQVNTTGVLYYTLDTETFSATKKMVVLK